MPGYRPTPTREAEAETKANFPLLSFTLPCYLLLYFSINGSLSTKNTY